MERDGERWRETRSPTVLATATTTPKRPYGDKGGAWGVGGGQLTCVSSSHAHRAMSSMALRL